MRNYWFLKGSTSEGLRWLDAALDRSGPDSPHRGGLLVGVTVFARNLGELDRALAAATAELAYLRERNLAGGIVSGLRDLGGAYAALEEFGRASELLDEALALARESSYPDLAVIAAQQAWIALRARRLDEARFDETARLLGAAGGLGDGLRRGADPTWTSCSRPRSTQPVTRWETRSTTLPLVSGARVSNRGWPRWRGPRSAQCRRPDQPGSHFRTVGGKTGSWSLTSWDRSRSGTTVAGSS
jgi:hypothetical protein